MFNLCLPLHSTEGALLHYLTPMHQLPLHHYHLGIAFFVGLSFVVDTASYVSVLLICLCWECHSCGSLGATSHCMGGSFKRYKLFETLICGYAKSHPTLESQNQQTPASSFTCHCHPLIAPYRSYLGSQVHWWWDNFIGYELKINSAILKELNLWLWNGLWTLSNDVTWKKGAK